MDEQVWKHRFVEKFVGAMTGIENRDHAIAAAYDIANSAYGEEGCHLEPEREADEQVYAVAVSQ